MWLTALAVVDVGPAHAQAITPPSPPECVSVTGIGVEIITCTGNLSPGVNLANGPGPYDILNVHSLTANITPASGTAGILFTSDGSVELNVDTGPFGIFTTAADGVFAAGDAGPVTINFFGAITTSGNGAVGIRAGGLDDLVSIVASGTIVTDGLSASGIAASTDNGPIDIRSSVSIATQGQSAHGIDVSSVGGAINILSMGNIATGGTDAIGIYATSTTGQITITSTSDITTSGGDSVGIFAETSGVAMVESSGNFLTRGDGAAGIAAAGQTGTAVISTGSIATEGSDAPGITAISDAEVGVAMSGSIATARDNSRGIWAQSLVNGMVAVGAGGTITTAGDDSDGIWADSSSGAVVVISSANITTTGQQSDGISAISGAALATVVNFGVVSANGVGSAGIFAEGQETQVENYGTVAGGPCCGGVMMDAVDLAVLMNYGTIIGQTSGEAIFGSGTDVRIENFGTVTGNVILFGSNSSYFFNQAGALFNSGEQVMSGFVVNDGTIAPGGRGSVLTTLMSDFYSQGAGGTYAVDLDPQASNPSDRNDYIVASNNAEVAGVVEVSVLSLPVAASETFIILTGMSSLTDNGLSLIASPALHATLFTDATNVTLGISVDFTVDSLNPNQRHIAADLNQVFLAGGGGVTPVLLGLLNTGNFDAYKNALNQLSPEIYSNAEIAALYSSLAFSNSLLSCKVNGTGTGTAAIIREGQCLWAGASANFVDTGTTSDQIGFTQTTGLFNAGAQVALDDVWRVGFGAGYQSSSLQTATNAQSEGSLAQAGLSVKYNPGPLLLAGAVSGGGAWYDTTRTMAFGGFTGVAEGDQDVGIVSGSLRAAYVLGSPHLYYKPILDLGLTHLELGGFTESGGGGAALTVAGGGQTVFSLAPTLEVGSEWWMSNGTLIRPMIRGGAIWYDGADFALTAAFAGAPLGVSPFTINTNIDEVMGLVGAGVEVINGGDAALRFSYDGQLGETTQIHTVGVKGSARF
ncbi:autotransporter domain-containing protein [Hyphomicrobium sp. xq]|uniref:Autotransporter domain-containing protein n=1 Tax=Hyphomicrobium album TaxID=2665159 RepID=A0A6I3KG57_9HYPH|nr:autotransporter outer membrane beta-barrel domain-containing protein [Hyphomicrobium album]MTD93373.1 autotransporter domain-containing protein [Hyphomicrobium album]